ncbi:MAG: BamA/TamA family outer membrane protein [Gammaproteobacteria bacterium]|nr:BamA/TamA family outer membrane protein [Gammaproteobacteria bacterium]
MITTSLNVVRGLSFVPALLLFSSLLQAAPEAPTPGEVQDVIRQEPPAPPIDPDTFPQVERRDVSPDRVAPGGRAIVIDSFEISGNTVFTDGELQNLISPYIGQALTLFEIYDIADVINAHYRDHSFTLASVNVPAQQITDGNVRLEIIEGRIGKVSIEGNRRFKFNALEKQLDHLAPGNIFRNDLMEREVLLMNDMPGLEMRAVVKPGEEYGSSDVVLRVVEDPLEYSVSVDNYGRDSIGEARLLADVAFNSLSGRGDRLYISALHSQANLLNYANISYSFPIGRKGKRLQFTANRSDYDVGAEFEDLGITGDTTSVRADYTWPLRRTRETNLIFTGGILNLEANSEIDDNPIPQNESNITLLEAFIFYNRILRNNSSLGVTALYSGNFQENESSITEVDDDKQRGKLRTDVSYYLPFARRWSFEGKAAAVYSPDPLVDTQKFSLGGPYSVRGYLPAEARGDYGAFVSAEIRRHFRIKGAPLSVGLFVDAGRVKTRLLEGETPDLVDQEDELGSAGVGLWFGPANKFSGSIMYAEPIDNHVSTNPDEDDGQFWATFSARF